MVLEVVPKLMNTMVVLLCDKGLEASDRALDGYFLIWRLLRASVEIYGLEGEVRRQLEAFKAAPANRTKTEVPSLGDFLPLLGAGGSPELAWQALAQSVLEETFDRNVLWACRDNPQFARPDRNVLGQGADMDRLQATFTSTKVSKRLLMFHALFLELVGKQSSVDLFFGHPPHHLRQTFKTAVAKILACETWPEFFAACRRPCPGPAALTNILKQAVKNSRWKNYHSDTTNFSRIQASGVSHILKKGETYKVGESVKSVRLELGSDSANILCGACLVYEDLTCAAVVSYDSRAAYSRAVNHSGDMQVEGKSKHIINVELGKLPASVTRLFFTLCSCGCADLSGFKKPSIKMQDADGTGLCTYNLESAGRAPTVVMATIVRNSGSWQVTAIGLPSRVRCCGNYSQVKRDIAGIKL
jgi:stress response protein SCP2